MPNKIVKKASRAFVLFDRLKTIGKEIGNRVFEVGAILHEVNSQGLYQDFGYESMRAFIADPEINMNPGTAWKWMSIYERFCVELGVSPGKLSDIDWTKLYMIKDLVDERNMMHILGQATHQSRSDLEKTVLQLKGGIEDEESCSHDFCFLKCGTCGQVRRKE